MGSMFIQWDQPNQPIRSSYVCAALFIILSENACTLNWLIPLNKHGSCFFLHELCLYWFIFYIKISLSHSLFAWDQINVAVCTLALGREDLALYVNS
jgi:hypothetical protein